MAVLTLEVVDGCPTCGQPLRVYSWREPALFVHGGHGATREVEVGDCAGCGFSIVLADGSVNPRPDRTPSGPRRPATVQR